MIITKLTDKIPYVLKSDKDSDSKTTFYIRSLSKRAMISIGIEAQIVSAGAESGISQEQADFMYNTVKSNILGFDGIVDEAGKDIPFKSFDLVLDNVEFDVVVELFHAITEVNTLSEEESKNSK